MSSNDSVQRHQEPNPSGTSGLRIVPTLVEDHDAVPGALDPVRGHDSPMAPPNAIKDFANDIQEVLDHNSVGLQETGRINYLPDEEIDRLVTLENIHRVLGQVSDQLAQYIEEKAPRTFIIMVLAIHEPSMRCEAMRAFFNHEFDDDCLPVKKISNICKYDWDSSRRTTCGRQCDQHGLRQCEGAHELRLNCFHHSVWNKRTFQNFYRDQWFLLLQRFDAETFEYPAIEDDRILPFLPSTGVKGEKAGYFAFVQQAQMLTKYQNAIENHGQPTIDIAIKTLKPVPDKDFKIEDEWHNEVAAHKELGSLDRTHLVQAIAAYQQRGQYCLLFEWADGGDLRSYWKSTDHPGLSSTMIYEYLCQLRGLTRALDIMHHTRQARSRRESQTERESSGGSFSSTTSDVRKDAVSSPGAESMSKVVEDEDIFIEESDQPSHPPPIFVQPVEEHPAPKVPNADGELAKLQRVATMDENWRHGDVKPDNILRFTGESSGLGTLKLADLGRAKHNDLVTKDRGEVEFDKWRTKPYEPPDLYIVSQKNMSRLFDIWSLGCVFFESIIWMLYGKDWLQDFAKTMKSADQNETPFWVRIDTSNNAAISPIVNKMIQYMLSNDPECSGSEPSAMRDLLDLVYNQMLVIDLPAISDIYMPGKRANTQAVLAALNSIISKSETNSHYLFTGKSRPSPSGLPEITPMVPSKDVDGKRPQKYHEQHLPLPGAGNLGIPTARRLDTYSKVPENRWNYEDDDSFAEMVYRSIAQEDMAECFEVDDALCKICQRLNIYRPELLPSRSLAQLKTTCCLCVMVMARAKFAGVNTTASISLLRSDSGFTIQSSEDVLGYNMCLRLCRFPDTSMTISPPIPFIPVGLPRLCEIGSEPIFLLLQSWLDDCDNKHGKRDLDCVSSRPRVYCPNRLLDVGSSVHEESSHIVDTKSLPATGDVKYLALSHRWGENTPTNPHFFSTNDNIKQHMKNIPDTDLPPNFRDAVAVARQLGIRYLWIDALCILQWTPNHPGDFQQEADSMQDIFSSAHCVLATSSATGMNSGFLHSNGMTPRSERKAVEIDERILGSRLFICDSPDDFQRDVIDGPLNSRAWVLQERALARRTIFFTNNQIYWECSGGFRCETMSKLANSEAALLGDSNFPAYVVKDQTKGARIALFERLYVDYCRLQLSHSTDKPLAIAGLEQRLSESLKDKSGAGVFEKHKGRCLLWRRAHDAKSFERISFADSRYKAYPPPSWSFMAYSGAITYLDIPGGTVEWAPLDIHLTGTGEKSWLYASQPLAFNANVFDFEIKAPLKGNLGLLVYDDPDTTCDKGKCVVIGKKGGILSYILVVRPTAKNEALYERTGVGYIPSGWIETKSIPVEIV